MRARIIALIILLVLIGLPLIVYWYFMVQKESSLTIIPSREGDYMVELRGTLEYSLLPLADKFLEYRQMCRGVCTIGPIPPVKYTVILSSTGNITTALEIQLTAGEKLELPYNLLSDITMTPYVDTDLGETPVLSPEYTLLSKRGDSLLVMKNSNSSSTLGWLLGEKYRPTRQLSSDIKKSTMDTSGEYIILEGTQSSTIIAKDFANETQFPLSLGVPLGVARYNNTWKVRTSRGVYANRNTQWEENLRFTDFIDISPYVRIGYIAREDTKRLSLGNFPTGNGVLIFLDRKTGKSYTLRDSIDIDEFYSVGGKPIIVQGGKRFTLEFSK